MAPCKNAYNSMGFNQYAQDLYDSDCFHAAFNAFETRTHQLGFESVLYSYIPRILIETSFVIKPVFHASSNYSPEYLKHYSEAQFEKSDPSIRAVAAGINQPIDWWGDVCSAFTNGESTSIEVIDTTKQYGIKNGVTIPLMSCDFGIAGASFINMESGRLQGIANPNLEELILCTRLFHSMVQSNACYKAEFVKTLLDAMNQTERRFLAGLARGQMPSEIAYELNTSERYLEQVMLKIRRKFSGVDRTEAPKINRNQLLYYAGLINIARQS